MCDRHPAYCWDQHSRSHRACGKRLKDFFNRQFFPQRRTEKLKKSFPPCKRFHSLLVVFGNQKTRGHSEIKQTRSWTMESLSGGELLKAQLASLSYNSSLSTTEYLAIFAWGVYGVYTVRGNLGSISSRFVSPLSLPHTTRLTKRLKIEPSGNLTKSFHQLNHGLMRHCCSAG